MSAQADLPVGSVVMRTEEEDPDALQGDAASRWVPKLDVLSILSCPRRVRVQLIDQEVTVPPRWEVRRRICAPWNN